MSKLYSSFLLVFLLVFGFLTIDASAATGTAERIDGATRFDVAANISKRGWSAGADTVFLVNYNAYADGLSAAPLAYQYNAPILLTHPNELTDVTSNEIKRLHAKKVIIVGGEGVVSNNVVSNVKALGINDVTRISGMNRYEVSKRVAEQMPKSDKVVVVYGMNFPDALAVAPYAAKNGYPILLTESKVIPEPIQEALDTVQPNSAIVVGGTGVVTPTVFDQLPSPVRIDGSDRYEVAANVVNKLKVASDKVNIATGTTFADALTGSVLAAKESTGILLSKPQELPSATSKAIKDNNINKFVVLGGTGAVSQGVVNSLIGVPPVVKGPLSGLQIVVDAGHGGKDPGAIGNGLNEKDVVLDVAKRLKTKLESAGAKVIMTRESDEFPSLEDRVVIANRAKANSFVSIHANSFSKPTAYGTETYWDSQYFGPESKALAQSIQTQLVRYLGTYDRGVKQAPFYVIKNSYMPSVLAELAFISNSEDAKKLGDPKYRESAATALYTGVMNYYKK